MWINLPVNLQFKKIEPVDIIVADTMDILVETIQQNQLQLLLK